MLTLLYAWLFKEKREQGFLLLTYERTKIYNHVTLFFILKCLLPLLLNTEPDVVSQAPIILP